MDVGNCNQWQSEHVVPSKDIVQMVNTEFPLEPTKANYYGEVAKRYRFKDGKGEIGFITSITQSFCHQCTRARLSTDGKLYTCLFATEGFDLRALLREGASDEELMKAIQNVWQQREDRYSQLRTELLKSPQPSEKIEMFHIGG